MALNTHPHIAAADDHIYFSKEVASRPLAGLRPRPRRHGRTNDGDRGCAHRPSRQPLTMTGRLRHTLS
ncbi:DUF4266 domain-containing protein [Asticcacaulis sp.]|uniref:DUF4266 domain-containing protein n=1 Tax=Asticcacaulis sp. TaxID=1872648 RepID=UPI002C0ACF19|nr:DUF4266 domain-containing protein [Asticcacaulis sp.]HTM82807.1 DUF4266 domain-containing protein [Asticcacaulis sp.]